jgi:hypothetical protein
VQGVASSNPAVPINKITFKYEINRAKLSVVETFICSTVLGLIAIAAYFLGVRSGKGASRAGSMVPSARAAAYRELAPRFPREAAMASSTLVADSFVPERVDT